MSTRIRPKLHFTAARGWINDQHGIVFDGANYHMFFQHHPASIQWGRIVWGHAISPDLIAWQELPTAIAPLETEVGCWSGSVILDAAQKPVLFYSSPTQAEWKISDTIVADGSADLSKWIRRAEDPLRTSELWDAGYLDVRDPNVRKDADRYRLVIGAGRRDETAGVVLSFSSDDLQQWQFDGELISRDAGIAEPFTTGLVWECPQFVQIGDRWLLLVSALDRNELNQVFYAIGDFENEKFSANSWGQFEATGTAYATSTFKDKDQRPCAMSWIKERDNAAPVDSEFAGAQSLPVFLELQGAELRLKFHSGLDDYFAVSAETSVGIAWRLQGSVIDGMDVEISAGWRLVYEDSQLKVFVGQEVIASMAARVGAEFDLVVDADIAELICAGSASSLIARVPAAEISGVRGIADFKLGLVKSC